MPRESFETMSWPDDSRKDEPTPQEEGREYNQELPQEDQLKKGLMENRTMYNLSGFPDITERDIQRYIHSNEKISEKIPETTREDIEDHNLDIREMAANMIRHAPEEARAELIRKGLEDRDILVSARATNMIRHAPKEAQPSLQEKLPEIIRENLEHVSWEVRKIAATMILRAPEEAQRGLWEVAEKKQQETAGPDLQKIAEQTPLYKSDERFFRKKFEKSGSKITLLDVVPRQPEKTLREKVIVRHIGIRPYLAWKKAFESYGYWREKGLDYVPVEPIIRVGSHELSSDAVDVSTRVLQGPSIATWCEHGGGFQREIIEQQEHIRAGLEELGVLHRDLHDDNFVLYFSRKKDGKPDILRPPRVYVIDFEVAGSQQ